MERRFEFGVARRVIALFLPYMPEGGLQCSLGFRPFLCAVMSLGSLSSSAMGQSDARSAPSFFRIAIHLKLPASRPRSQRD